MGCSMWKGKDGSIRFICGTGVTPCSVCGDLATALCDYPVGKRKTCDQPLCDKHAIKQGAEWQDIHFCPTHVLIASGKVNLFKREGDEGMSRKFTWSSWDFDCDGDAYVIAKAECPNREDVPDFICREDPIPSDCRHKMMVEEGWCKYQVRTDWANGDGEPQGGYCVRQDETATKRSDGRRKPGWFPVWIVRKGEWY